MAWNDKPNYAPGNLTVNEGYVPAYQGSGKPFVTSSLEDELGSGVVAEVKFPAVTRWVQVNNTGGGDMRVGFSTHGVNATEETNYYILQTAGSAVNDGQSVRWELKCKSMFLRRDASSDTDFSIVAGLTDIRDLNVALSGSRGIG